MPPEELIEAIRAILRRIGLELAFVDAAKDGSTTPLEPLLQELSAAVRDTAPEAIVSTVVAAATWLSGPAADATERLTIWHPWLDEAVTAWSRGDTIPPLPTPLTQPAPASAATPARAATQAPAAERRPSSLAVDTAPVTVLPDGHDDELMRLFCSEALELLQEIEQGVLVLETSPAEADTLATVFRAFHTVKGNAAVMKLVVLQRLTHELESLLDAARRGARPLDRDAIEIVLAGADAVAAYVAETSRQLDGHEVGRAIPLPVQAIVDRVHSLLSQPAVTAHKAPHPGTAPLPAKAAESAGVSPRAAGAPREATEPTGAVSPTAPAPPPPAPQSPVPTPAAPSPPLTSAPKTAPTVASSGSVRVDTAKLDGLLDLVGELVIAQSMVVEAAGGADESLVRSLTQLRGITSDLQRTAMAIRMVPIRGAFQKMGRLVRDTAVGLGKEIRLIVEGAETELDRTVIEEIGDPLVHMIRNAADHAIESPAERIAAGKPEVGTIRLSAYHQGGFVVVRVSDDGRGLDPTRIRAKAVEKGLISADAILDIRDTLELIFAPGFSTAAQVSDLSGRGVGLDVVRRNVERVRGKVEVESVKGRGTTFTLSMPLTLAIIEGLVVAVAGQRFVIPALAVRESFRPLSTGLASVHGRGELVAVRGQQVPLVRLGRHLGITGAIEDATRAIVVVLEAGSDRRCLLVDELVGKQEVVIKPLGESFVGRTPFAGAAILGDGRVGLILDSLTLVRLGKRSPTETAA
jgi:two-component system chemotaxis sensor kinase CheA